MLQFGLSEKHTKLKENFPHGFDKSADLLSKHQNHEEEFSKHEQDISKLCVLLKKKLVSTVILAIQ